LSYRLKPGGNCPYDSLNWIDDNGNEQSLDLYFQNGQSKGLKNIAIELGYELASNIKLDPLREILSKHPAFNGGKKLANLAKKYGIRLIYIPKYHCELNPVEGLWCNQKQYVRVRNNQSFKKMCQLIKESRKHFVDNGIHLKLFKRFWNVIRGYKNKATYSEILNTYFTGKSKAKQKEHLRISNKNLK
jgi:transposase